MHDCSKCGHTEECPIVQIAPWLNDHERETEDAVRGEKEPLTKLCAYYEEADLSTILDPKFTAHCVGLAFVLGYHKGRTFPAVPAAFEKPFGG